MPQEYAMLDVDIKGVVPDKGVWSCPGCCIADILDRNTLEEGSCSKQGPGGALCDSRRQWPLLQEIGKFNNLYKPFREALGSTGKYSRYVEHKKQTGRTIKLF